MTRNKCFPKAILPTVMALAVSIISFQTNALTPSTTTPTVDDPVTPASGILPPVDSVESDGPFTPAQDKNTGHDGRGWVVHPTALGENGLKHPVYVWGTGFGTGPELYESQLNRIASHGFVVYGQSSNFEGKRPIKAIDWLMAQNDDPDSPYYQKLDTKRIAIGGHSLGALSSNKASGDPRISTSILVSATVMDGSGPSYLKKPTLYVSGEDDFGKPFTDENYAATTTVPAFYSVIEGVDHVDASEESLPVMISWLRWHIGGEDFREEDFLAPSCTFCTGRWQSDAKNW